MWFLLDKLLLKGTDLLIQIAVYVFLNKISFWAIETKPNANLANFHTMPMGSPQLSLFRAPFQVNAKE